VPISTPCSQIHLIEEPARGRYRFHELLGDYARALAATDPPGHQDRPSAGCWSITPPQPRLQTAS
jgi:hypothetical protein